MPELPEVELCALSLRRWLLGRRITRVTALPGVPLRGDTTPAALSRALVGREVTAIERRGKQLVLLTDGPPALLVHLGMTGHWSTSPEGARIALEVAGGVAAMRDVRRLGRVRLVDRAALEAAPEWSSLGPDALTVAGRKGKLAALLGDARVPVKVALMDQARIAGVGNIYASEACFAARVDPRVRADALPVEAFDRIGRAVVASMRRTLRLGRRDPDFAYLSEGGENVFAVYGREGAPCPSCARPVVRFEQAGRSTFACLRCQARPAPPKRRPARR